MNENITYKNSKSSMPKPYEKERLQIIPKMEDYIIYMFDIVLEKIPRTEKYSLGTNYKTSMYNMMREAYFINKISNKDKILYCLNSIDAEMDFQRCLLRIIHNHGWISHERYNHILGMLYEIGKMLGGLIKFYKV